MEHSNAVGTRRATIIVVSAVLAVLAVHMVTAWGYIGLYWGDSGRWLYEVDRYADGARIYRDVYWGFPPLGMWIVGGAARLIGSDLVQVWSITATIAALLGVRVRAQRRATPPAAPRGPRRRDRYGVRRGIRQ